MHYANEKQLSALKELGFTPTEDKTPLTEVAQWLWEKYRLCAEHRLYREGIDALFSIPEDKIESFTNWKFKRKENVATITEALSWAIDQAIKYLQENAKQ